MPIEIGILKKLDKGSLDAGVIRALGNTSYAWTTYEGDVQINGINQVIQLEGVAKLGQSIFKIVMTPKGAHAEDPDYGTNLQSLVGEKFDSDRFAETKRSIIDALVHLNAINRDNPNSDEVIQTIDTIDVSTDLDEPRAMRVRIVITTESGKQVDVEAPQII